MRHGGMIATLESYEAELRTPVRALSPFGSARGDDRTDSDVDVAVELGPTPISAYGSSRGPLFQRDAATGALKR